MNFPNQFISATIDYADFGQQVPAPYIRKKFTLKDGIESAELFITGLGFYRVFINEKEVTKSILAPYISNPDDIIYYDAYNIQPYLQKGDNVIGIILGNGMQNAYGGFVWDFDKVAWRSAPMTALRMDIKLEGGEMVFIESDTSFLTHPSPLLEDELRCGEYYDARLCVDDWCSPSLKDADWKPVIKVIPPRGKKRLCQASPIKVYEKIKAVAITPYEEGYLYDFGVDMAGVCELKITGTPGQEIRIFYGEWYHDGILEKSNLTFPEFDSPYVDNVQESCYICKGDGEETYKPYFTYYGFRYAYVRGIKPEQATKELLVYHSMGGDFKEVGNFSCSDDIANQLQTMTRRSTISNFFWFPTDCPHREKNGWTGDAALSAEHMLMNLTVENSLHEWLRNVEEAQASDGGFPGIVPTGEWGFGTGPAWDQVIVEIPYYLLKLRGDIDTAREAAPYIFRYLFYISQIRNKRGLVDIGLGDWCETGKSGGGYKAPIEVTDTAICVHSLAEAKILFQQLNMQTEYEYANKLLCEMKQAFRKRLIHYPTMTVAGSCQTAQAMAIHYGLFKKSEKPVAFSRLLEMIHQNGNHMNGGALGLRVLFHVLSDYGEADLAYEMITRLDYPSYGNWIARGATALWEDFLPPNTEVHSQNHHFFGDISNWFIQSVAGIVPNPYVEDANHIVAAPHFINVLTHAEASYKTPSGRITLHWKRIADPTIQSKDLIEIRIKKTSEINGTICLPKGWDFEDGFCEKTLEEGTYVCRNMA